MMIFERHTKKFQTIAMKEETGKVVFIYNKPFKRLTVKTYFRNRRISRNGFKIDSFKTLSILKASQNNKIELVREIGTIRNSPRFFGLDDKGEVITERLERERFDGRHTYSTGEKIEKIKVKEKLKNDK